LPIYLAFLGVAKPPATLTALYTLLIAFLMVSRLPVFSGKDRAHARAAGNGAAGFRLRDLLHRALDRLSLAHSVGGSVLYLLSLPLGLEVLSRPRARRRGAGRTAAECRAAVRAPTIRRPVTDAADDGRTRLN
jgi:CDP-diacylglycerol--serine O-phosphatidyltransferase